ncbi:hypothetical protein EGJ22_22655 [Pseudomonas sp. p99-361]|nr:hypothetical protein HV87_08680 [Pseudomonas aeruginosa]RRV05809.1 hypothetical protein EGJ22_22655 [Pseudomonas sp. p99-361]
MPAGNAGLVGAGMPANARVHSPPSSRARPLPQRPHSNQGPLVPGPQTFCRSPFGSKNTEDTISASITLPSACGE